MKTGTNKEKSLKKLKNKFDHCGYPWHDFLVNGKWHITMYT